MIWNLSTEKLPFQLKNSKEDGLLLSIDKCQSYQAFLWFNRIINRAQTRQPKMPQSIKGR
jgi:hypothetical protein